MMAVMAKDRLSQFIELSALLTGLNDRLINDSEEAAFNLPIAREYLRRLRGTFPSELERLLTLYEKLTDNPHRLPIGDDLLKLFFADPDFQLPDDQELHKRLQLTVNQIIYVWYFSQFFLDSENKSPVDAGFFHEGAVWPIIGAHPPGFTNGSRNYWAKKP
jgi:hypothetical protein